MESNHEYFQVGYIDPNLDNGPMSMFLDYQPTDQCLSNSFSDDMFNSGINDDVEQWQAASMAAINTCYTGSAPILTPSSSDRLTLLAAPIFTPDPTPDLQHQATSADMDFMQETFVQHQIIRNFSSDSIAELGS